MTDEQDELPECDHVDYEADVLTGRATCACGHSWWQTPKEIQAERRYQAEYNSLEEKWGREERSLLAHARQFWARITAWRRPKQTDEIPF